MRLNSTVLLVVGLTLAAHVGGVARAAEDLWDMTAVRRQTLDVEPAAKPRTAPLVTAEAGDWMNTGDAWVAKKPGKPAKKESASASGAKPAGDNEQLLVEELFLSSESTPDGPNRIFVAVARPQTASGPVPVVLIFHGGGGHASGALALAAARRHPGMAGVAMDYNGQFAPGPKGQVTQWKNVSRERKLDLVPDLRSASMYHNVVAARRTIDFLETQPWADAGRVGAVGISYGGWVALLLAGVDERVKCVTTAVSAGGAGLTAGRAAQQLRWDPAEQRELWLKNYEPLAYAPRTKAAVFFQLAANDLFFWLNGAAAHLAALPGEKGWLVRPNSNHGAGGPEIPDTAAGAFMRHVLAGGPDVPHVREFTVSDDGRTYAWQAEGSSPIARAVLNWSPGKAVSPGRYWIEFPAARDGQRWTAQVPAEFGPLAAQAFATVGDEAGLVVSGPLVVREGLDPMTVPGPAWEGGQLWDVARGAAAWRTPAGWYPKTALEFVPPAGIRLGPEAGGKEAGGKEADGKPDAKEFTLLTNSAGLASGAAAQHAGLQIVLQAGTEAGQLRVTLLRDTNSLDERAYAAEIAYPAGSSRHEIPWTAFRLATKNVTAGPMPCPFDGLSLSGTRNSGTPLTVESITFLPRPVKHGD